MKSEIFQFVFIFSLVLAACDSCTMGSETVTVKAYSNSDDYKATLVDVKVNNFRGDLSGYAKVIFLYGQVLELCLKAFDVDTLEVIQMNYMGIYNIQPGAFVNLPNLRVLNLKANNLTSVASGVFNGLPVSYLLLSSNKINYIDRDALDDLPNLEMVFLDGNKLTFVDPSWFKRSPKLRVLSLDDNKIREIQKWAFIQLTSSDEQPFKLILSYNEIQKIDGQAFESIQYFDTLELSHNSLVTLPFNIFSNAIYVKNLGLNYNRLILNQTDVKNFAKVVENISLTGNHLVDCSFFRGFLSFPGKNLTSKNKCYDPFSS